MPPSSPTTRERSWASFPYAIEVSDDVRIPVGDGVELSTRIWMPVSAGQEPVPALVECNPYRKRDAYAVQDAQRHAYLAGHGYASVRIELRGSGDSDGTMSDEYLPVEQQDICDAIDWIASQSWCTGRVGLFGLSWGGFSALQVAARQPAALDGIVVVAASDDRYQDDVHYLGGCVLGSEMLSWSTAMLAFNGRPDARAVLGDGWQEHWIDRLESLEPFVHHWLAHQERDWYWKQGSVNESYDAIKCPVYAVGGWADPYRDAVLRLMEHLRGPRKGLIGPWSHAYPHVGSPGPAIGFLQEMLRWWDHWLKDQDTGIMSEPTLHLWMSDASGPGEPHLDRSGRWIAEPGWPTDTVNSWSVWPGSDEGLHSEALPGAKPHMLPFALSHGRHSGTWVPDLRGAPQAAAAAYPGDQREEDAHSATFTSGPLDESIELLGRPQFECAVVSDQPVATLVARLVAVAPAGDSQLVARGVLNLTHRDSHERPRPLEVGAEHRVVIQLEPVACRIPAGHRIRLALSSSYWPWAWPPPTPTELQVVLGPDTKLRLPKRFAGRDVHDTTPGFDPPEMAQPPLVHVERTSTPRRSIEHDLGSGRQRLVWTNGDGTRFRIEPEDLEYEQRFEDDFVMVDGDPLSARATSTWYIELAYSDQHVRLEAGGEMWSDAESFYVRNQLVAHADGEEVFRRQWERALDRQLT